MSDTPEPLSAILAEFRQFALRAAEEDKMISPESVLLLADKVETAANREREENGAIIRACMENANTLAKERDRLRDELTSKTQNYEDVIAFHTRTEESLRDIVRRFLDLFTPGAIHPAGTMERLLRDARAVIGEEKP